MDLGRRRCWNIFLIVYIVTASLEQLKVFLLKFKLERTKIILLDKIFGMSHGLSRSLKHFAALPQWCIISFCILIVLRIKQPSKLEYDYSLHKDNSRKQHPTSLLKLLRILSFLSSSMVTRNSPL